MIHNEKLVNTIERNIEHIGVLLGRAPLYGNNIILAEDDSRDIERLADEILDVMRANKVAESCFGRANTHTFAQCTEEDYIYALEVLPPKEHLPNGNGFVIGEPYDAERWYCFWRFGAQYWCALLTLAEARTVTDISDAGITYTRQYRLG